MADGERRVDMVRLERPEEVYDVEEVLGRDIKSVFPTKAKTSDSSVVPGQLDADAVREMIGGKKFVSQKELEEIQARRGQQDGADESSLPLKPLVEVLREAKDKKEQAFADMWKQMKTGKNRPLDEEELAFLESVAEQDAARRRQQQLQEQQELEEFRQATAAAGQAVEVDAAATTVSTTTRQRLPASGQQAQQQQTKPAGAAKPLIRALVKPKAKGPAVGQLDQGVACTTGARRPVDDDVTPSAKRLKGIVQDEGQQAAEEGAGLAGLLGYEDSDDN